MLCYPDTNADIEVIIKNNRPSKDNLYTGYRPAFKVKEDYLTTGLIRLIDCDEVRYGKETIAEVWFVAPEHYPHCLEVGQTIHFQDGAKVQGFVTITKINNKILEK